MLKSGRFHPVFEGFPPPPLTCRFPILSKSGNIHPNVHVVFTELVLGSFPENHLHTPTYGVFDMRAIENDALKPGPILVHCGPPLVQFLKAHQPRINTGLIQFWSTWSAF